MVGGASSNGGRSLQQCWEEPSALNRIKEPIRTLCVFSPSLGERSL